MFLKDKRWPFVLFFLSVLIAVQIVVATNYFQKSYFEKMHRDIKEIDQALTASHAFRHSFQETFLAHRAYVLTAEKRYLNRYNKSLLRFDERLQHLKERDSKILSDIYINRISAFALQQRDSMQYYTQLTQEKGLKTLTPADIRSIFKKALNLEDAISAIIDQERTFLNNYQAKERARQINLNRLTLISALGSLGLLAVLGLLAMRYQQSQMRTEQDLHDTKERMAMAIRGSRDGVWDWNITTGDIYYSSQVKAAAGYGHDEMPSDLKAFDALVHPDDLAGMWKDAWDYLNRKSPYYETMFRIRHKDGSYRWIMSRGEALWDATGKPLRMVGVHTDITKKKILEEDLGKARQAAEDANEAKSHFLASVSHEIRTPLSAVIGLAYILSKAKPLSEDLRDHVTILSSAAENLQSLVNDLLDLSKIEQDSLILEQNPFSFNSIIQHSIDLYRFPAEKKNLNLSFDTTLPDDHTLLGDSLRLGQIVNNLLSNAIKFTESGSVSVSLSLDLSIAEKNKTHVVLKVEDTGIGIPADRIDRIFERFIQSDESIQRRFGGTGLGLSICYELCQLMNAKIDVHSVLGQGTEFIIHFAFANAENEEPLQITSQEPEILQIEKPLEDKRKNTGEKILLVEDYPANAFVIKALLTSLGYECDVCGDGAQVTHLGQRDEGNDYCLVLMDIELPDTTGYQLTEFIRDKEVTEGLEPRPIIAMTAHALKGDSDRCLQVGMEDYLVKPVDISALQKILRKYGPYRISSGDLMAV